MFLTALLAAFFMRLLKRQHQIRRSFRFEKIPILAFNHRRQKLPCFLCVMDAFLLLGGIYYPPPTYTNMCGEVNASITFRL